MRYFMLQYQQIVKQVIETMEYFSSITNTTGIDQTINSQSINFKQRINRLKAKIKPNILLPPTMLTSSLVSESGNFTQRDTYIGKNYFHCDEQMRSIMKSVINESENKINDGKVSYRKEALNFKKKPKQKIDALQQNLSLTQKIGSQLFKNITLKDHSKLFKDCSNNQQLNKQNIGNNYKQIEDILINTYKSPLSSDRSKDIKSKSNKILKGITTIDVRQCSAKSSSTQNLEYSMGSNRIIQKLKGLKSQNGVQHLKTQSHDSRTKQINRIKLQ